jgi:hypothetical protein
MHHGRLFSRMADPSPNSAARATWGDGGSPNAGTAEVLLLIDRLQIGDRGSDAVRSRPHDASDALIFP